MTHWTDRMPTETLSEYIWRIYENCDWAVFEGNIAKLKSAGLPFPGPMVETLYYLREMEKQQHDPL